MCVRVVLSLFVVGGGRAPKISYPYYYKATNTFGVKADGREVLQARRVLFLFVRKL